MELLSTFGRHAFRPRWTTAGLTTVIAMLWIGAAVGQTTASDDLVEAALDDRDLEYAIGREFRTDPVGPFPRVDVSSQEGIVTLRGTVPHLHAKTRAVAIASDTRGVRAVIDRIEVEMTGRADRAIASDVRAVLRRSVSAVQTLDVTVMDGLVVLRGSVPSWGEKRLAVLLASRVWGVTDVQAEIMIDPPTTRGDKELERAVTEALDWDGVLEGTSLSATVENGVVTLTGSVRSLAEREHAENVAWLTGGRVVNADGVVIRPAGHGAADRREARPRTPRGDIDIQSAVEAAVRRDPRVRPLEFEPTVDGSMVTLRGIVTTEQESRRIEQDARNTTGVRGIRNHLRVRPGRATDDLELEQEVVDALSRNPYVYRFDVDVDAVNGEIVLRGAVDTVFERTQAEAVASDVVGVSRVDNLLEVRAPNRAYLRDPMLDELYALEGEFFERSSVSGSLGQTDAEIRADIVDELRWSPLVDADRILVAVEGGITTLTGTVDTWRQRNVASDNAYEGGAAHVINRLTVADEDDASTDAR